MRNPKCAAKQCPDNDSRKKRNNQSSLKGTNTTNKDNNYDTNERIEHSSKVEDTSALATSLAAAATSSSVPEDPFITRRSENSKKHCPEDFITSKSKREEGTTAVSTKESPNMMCNKKNVSNHASNTTSTTDLQDHKNDSVPTTSSPPQRAESSPQQHCIINNENYDENTTPTAPYNHIPVLDLETALQCVIQMGAGGQNQFNDPTVASSGCCRSDSKSVSSSNGIDILAQCPPKKSDTTTTNSTSSREMLSPHCWVTFRTGHVGDASALAQCYRQQTIPRSELTNHYPSKAEVGTTKSSSSRISNRTETSSGSSTSRTTACQNGGEEGSDTSLEVRLAEGMGENEDIPPAIFALIADVTHQRDPDTPFMGAAALLSIVWNDGVRILDVEWLYVTKENKITVEEANLLERRLVLRLSALALMTSCQSLLLPTNRTSVVLDTRKSQFPPEAETTIPQTKSEIIS